MHRHGEEDTTCHAGPHEDCASELHWEQSESAGAVECRLRSDKRVGCPPPILGGDVIGSLNKLLGWQGGEPH